MEIRKINTGKILPLKQKRIKCPTCKKPALVNFSPFCSKKSADLDLSKWLTDWYHLEINKD